MILNRIRTFSPNPREIVNCFLFSGIFLVSWVACKTDPLRSDRRSHCVREKPTRIGNGGRKKQEKYYQFVRKQCYQNVYINSLCPDGKFWRGASGEITWSAKNYYGLTSEKKNNNKKVMEKKFFTPPPLIQTKNQGRGHRCEFSNFVTILFYFHEKNSCVSSIIAAERLFKQTIPAT